MVKLAVFPEQIAVVGLILAVGKGFTVTLVDAFTCGHPPEAGIEYVTM